MCSRTNAWFSTSGCHLYSWGKGVICALVLTSYSSFEQRTSTWAKQTKIPWSDSLFSPTELTLCAMGAPSYVWAVTIDPRVQINHHFLPFKFIRNCFFLQNKDICLEIYSRYMPLELPYFTLKRLRHVRISRLACHFMRRGGLSISRSIKQTWFVCACVCVCVPACLSVDCPLCRARYAAHEKSKQKSSYLPSGSLPHLQLKFWNGCSASSLLSTNWFSWDVTLVGLSWNLAGDSVLQLN